MSRTSLFLAGCLPLASILSAAALADETPVRATAVVDLSFDEKSGPAVDTASGGRVANNGQLVAGVRRVPSPFFGQSGGRALLLDGGRKQFVQVASSLDTSRPQAVTVACLFLNLHGPGDTAYRGLFAKRATDKAAVTNYGINFSTKSDRFQVYVNDGSGFRVVVFSVKATIGTRRRVHLVTSFQVGDAPGADKDKDADDLRIRLIVNGQQATRIGKPDRDLADGKDIWLLDLKPAGLLNQVPLTLGSSTPAAEHANGVLDEFQLFDRELSIEEAGRLFTEVSGADAAKLATADLTPQAAIQPAPAISTLSLRGLQISKETTLVISGKNLGPNPDLLLSIPGATATVAKDSNASRLVLGIALPATTPAGLYPLRVRTPGGISNPLPVAVDHLPQSPLSSSTPEKPTTLPAALSGTLAGSQIARAYLNAKRGQRIVADVEARRLGASCEPVIEFKNAQGTPLAIEWSKVELRGDTRTVVTIPADGVYTVEIHDLSYKAPAGSSFRLKIGDLALVDTVFPSAAVAGTQLEVQPIGTGLPDAASLKVDLRSAEARLGTLVLTSQTAGLLGPAPVIRISRGTEVLETAAAPIDARFSATRRPPLTINGRITRPGERDVFTLDVTPGQKLQLALNARTIHSPLDGQLTVLVANKPLASSQDRPGSRDPMLTYSVPADVKQLQVAVTDLYRRGGNHFLYRLSVSPAGEANFSLQLQTPQLNMPRVGTALVRLQVNRAGYNGPIQLHLAGDDHITMTPSQIPAGTSGAISIILARTAGGDASGTRSLNLVGETVGLKPALRRVARVANQVIPAHEDLLPTGLTRPSGATLQLRHQPLALYRGLPARLTVIARGIEPGNRTGQAVRIAALSNEPPRRIDPKNAKKGNKPLVRILPSQSITIGGAPATVLMAVPSDVTANQIEFVLRGDLVAHGYATSVQGRIYSQPFRLPVRNAASVTLDPKTTTLPSNTLHSLRGTLKRDPGFNEAVEIEILVDKRLAGFSGTKVTVPAGQSTFELKLQVGQENEPRTVPGIRMSVRLAGGGPLLPDQVLALKSTAPAPKKKK